MLAHSERANGLTAVRLWLVLERRATDRSDEPWILRSPDELLLLTPLCRDLADAPRCPSSFRTIAQGLLRARSLHCAPRLATRPCRRGSLLRATRAPLSFDPRCASRYEPSRHELALVSSGRDPYAESGVAQEPALAAPPISPIGERSSTALSRRSFTRSSAAEARSRARSAWDASGGDPGPFDRYLQPTRFIFNDESDRLGAFRIVLPTRFGSCRFYAGNPLRRSVRCLSAVLRSAGFTPPCAARRTSDVLDSLTTSDRDEPRARMVRELRAELRRAA